MSYLYKINNQMLDISKISYISDIKSYNQDMGRTYNQSGSAYTVNFDTIYNVDIIIDSNKIILCSSSDKNGVEKIYNQLIDIIQKAKIEVVG